MIRIALVGVGHIARHEHLPALRDHPAFRVVAVVSPVPVSLDLPVFTSIEALIESGTAIDAVSICTPPDCRYDLACKAIAAGWHVLLEKPPTLTRSQGQILSDLAKQKRCTLFSAWHSVYAAAIAPLQTILREHDPVAVKVAWKENADKWHPGAEWLWRPGALGVFDAGINALSILCAVSAEPIVYCAAKLDFFGGQQAPARAVLDLAGGYTACPVQAVFDWRHDPSSEIWTICWTMSDGRDLTLTQGGACLADGGKPVALPHVREYAGVYDHFATLIASGTSLLDLRPLDLVTEALAFGTRVHFYDSTG